MLIPVVVCFNLLAGHRASCTGINLHRTRKSAAVKQTEHANGYASV